MQSSRFTLMTLPMLLLIAPAASCGSSDEPVIACASSQGQAQLPRPAWPPRDADSPPCVWS
jgi:hypothetical protein